MVATLSDELAERIATLALAGVERPYPYKPGTVLRGASDLVEPSEATPAFYGCFDWHSAVHAHWSLSELLRRFPAGAWVDDARRVLRSHLCAELIEREVELRQRDARFEMPYGVAWLVALQASLQQSPSLDAQARALRPLTELAMRQSLDWFRALPCPIRGGEHSQSAFALSLMIDSSRLLSEPAWESELIDVALCHHTHEGPAALHHEPSAYDFLSPSLSIAELMSRVFSQEDFARWLQGVLPQPSFEVVRAADPEDGKLCHWEGLNLSRSWMMRRIGHALDESHPARDEYLDRANEHLVAGLASLEGEHYAGTHWLGTFALRALT